MKRWLIIALLVLSGCSNTKNEVVETAACQLVANDTTFRVEFKIQNKKLIEMIDEIVIPKSAMSDVELTNANFNEAVTNELYDYPGVSYSLNLNEDETKYFQEKIVIDFTQANVEELVSHDIIKPDLVTEDGKAMLDIKKIYTYYEDKGFACIK